MITYNSSDLILAPIAGYSDVGMRTLCFMYGAGLCFTEMVSAKGLLYNNANTAALLTVGEGERYTGVQLFGREPEIIAQAVADERLKKFPIIDINMGCPVPKIVKNGEGSALMRDPELIHNIVKAAVSEAGERLVSVKLRAGFYDGYENAVECAQAAEEGGAAFVTVHGRTREQFYSGKADYDIIRNVKESVKIPVVGNGDVTDRESYLKMKATGADYVMIARGAFGRPYIFSEIKGESYVFDLKQAILTHMECLKFLPERTAVNVFKKHLAHYVKGRRGQRELKEKIFSAETYEDLIAIIASI